MDPLGCTSPYASFTAKTAVLGLTPDRLSAIVPDIVTAASLPLGGQRVGGLAEAVTRGEVLSMLMLLTVVDAKLPATSTQVPLTDCAAPSVETTPGAGGLPAASPDSESEHVKLTITSVLFQPF